jgi:hypothetical protein
MNPFERGGKVFDFAIVTLVTTICDNKDNNKKQCINFVDKLQGYTKCFTKFEK